MCLWFPSNMNLGGSRKSCIMGTGYGTWPCPKSLYWIRDTGSFGRDTGYDSEVIRNTGSESCPQTLWYGIRDMTVRSYGIRAMTLSHTEYGFWVIRIVIWDTGLTHMTLCIHTGYGIDSCDPFVSYRNGNGIRECDRLAWHPVSIQDPPINSELYILLIWLGPSPLKLYIWAEFTGYVLL